MRIGIIGFGSAGERHYNNLQKYTKDIVVFSKRKDVNVSCLVNDWGEFKKFGPFDLVFITNETHKHVQTIKKCLKMGFRAFFVEKPISHNLRGLAALRRLVHQKKIILWVGYNRHFYQPLIEIKKFIQGNKLGKIYYLRVSIGQNLKDWRRRDYRLTYSSKKEQGGGVMLDLVHEINYAGWMLGETLEPKAGVNRKLSNLETDVEDCAESLLVSKNGTIVSIHQDYLNTVLKWSVEVVGSSGNINWERRDRKIIFQNDKKTIVRPVFAEYNKMFEAELVYLFKMLGKKKFFTNIDEACRDIEIIEKLKRYGQK